MIVGPTTVGTYWDAGSQQPNLNTPKSHDGENVASWYTDRSSASAQLSQRRR
jgi:hypothetical protein